MEGVFEQTSSSDVVRGSLSAFVCVGVRCSFGKYWWRLAVLLFLFSLF